MKTIALRRILFLGILSAGLGVPGGAGQTGPSGNTQTDADRNKPMEFIYDFILASVRR